MFDTSNFTNAYMLVYERKLKTLMRRIADPLEVEKSKDDVKVLECENTALARAEQIYFDPNKKEYLTFTGFNDVVPKVPKSYYQEVWEDNNTLIFERQIYSHEFLSFVQNMLNESYSLLGSLPLESASAMAVSMTHIGSGLVVKILARAYYNAAIDPVTDQLIKLFRSSEAATNEFLRQLDSEVHEYHHLLIKCPDKDVREAVAKLLTESLTVAINRDKSSFDFTVVKEKDAELHLYKSLVTRVLDSLLSLIDPKLGQDWTRFGPFFRVLLGVAKNGGEPAVLYMHHRALETVLLDFYLENKSPLRKKDRAEMGNRFENPKFQHLIDLLCYLLGYADLSFMQPRYGELREKWGLPKVLYELSEEAKMCLKCEDFLSKTICECYVTESFNNYLAILSYEAKRFSKMLAMNLLSVINGDATVDVNLCFSVLKKIFSIEDSLQQRRFEWLLGIPGMDATVVASSEEPVRFGLRHIGHLDDNVVSYVSPLSCSGNSSCLLTLLWKFNKSFEISPTKCLLDLMITNEKVFAYVVQMPPPTYQYAKYPDWIKPFVEAYSQSNQNTMRFASYFYSAKKVEDCKKTMKYLEEYEKLWAEFAGREKYASRGDVLMGCSLPYLVGKVLEEKEIVSESKEGVTVRISEVTTEVYQSLPKVTANDGIPPCYADKTKLKSEKLVQDSPKRVTFEDAENKKEQKTAENSKSDSKESEAKREEKEEVKVGHKEVEPLKSEPTILKIKIQNSKRLLPLVGTQRIMKVKLNLEAKGESNFFMPASTLTSLLKTSESGMVYLFPKKTLGRPWGDFGLTWSAAVKKSGRRQKNGETCNYYDMDYDKDCRLYKSD